MFLKIHIVLLLFAIGSYAHTLSRIQITNGSDIYEIREKPNSMFEIIDPKPKQPILREIVFFKIIETPYNNHLEKDKQSEEEGPDFDDSKRPFTNGPGFQFLDYDPENNSRGNSNESKNDSSDSDSHENRPGSHDNKNDSSDSDSDSSDSSDSDSDSSSNESKDKNKPTKSDGYDGGKTYNNNLESYKDKSENSSSDADKKDKSKDSDKIEDVSQNSEPAATLNKTETAIQERNKQFDLAKDKYQEINKKSNNSTILLRSKRDIDFRIPPPPPALPPLNVEMFPDFIQRMISNIPALKDIVSPDERADSNDPDEMRPRTYGFHLNKDKNLVWNHLPLINQENYVNEPINMINKEKNEEYSENNSPSSSSDVSNSDSDDDNSINSNDSGYSVGADEGSDRSSEDDSVGGAWPGINAPQNYFNNFKSYNPITKENDLYNFGNKINKDTGDLMQHEPITQASTETNIKYPNKMSKERVPEIVQKINVLPKTKININKDLKEKIEMSFDNIGKMVPPTVTRFEENLVKTAIENKPLTYGMKLSGDNGYVWNELSNPGNPYFVGETLDKNSIWNEPSSPATEHFNEYNTDPTAKGTTEANEPTSSPLHEETNKGTENNSQKPTTDSVQSYKPNKESLDEDKNNSDTERNNEPIQLALDDLLKKDEFWQWLTKWTAAYIEVLNEHVEELVKREVAKQVNKTMNHKNEEEKDKIYTNNKDLDNKNETIANVTTVETANKTNEVVANNTATEKSIPENNNTDVIIAPETDKINPINTTVSEGNKSNKTTPANAHTIYGNAIDSDHVTNIFIFYPNAENNGTAKEIEAILGKPNNNVVVLGNPLNDNKGSVAPDSNKNSPVDYNSGIYAIDKKKDIVSNTTESTSETPESNISKEPSTTSKGEPTSETTAKDEDTTATTLTNTSVTSEAPASSNTESNTNASTDAVNSNVTESTTVNNTETATNAVDSSTAAPDTSTASK